MKKCDKIFGDCSKRYLKRAATALGRKFKPEKLKQLWRSAEQSRINASIAPHNTTEFLMRQHTAIDFDPEELLGVTFGVTYDLHLARSWSMEENVDI